MNVNKITKYTFTFKASKHSKKLQSTPYTWFTYLCSSCNSSAATCGLPSRKWNLALARINIGRLGDCSYKQQLTRPRVTVSRLVCWAIMTPPKADYPIYGHNDRMTNYTQTTSSVYRIKIYYITQSTITWWNNNNKPAIQRVQGLADIPHLALYTFAVDHQKDNTLYWLWLAVSPNTIKHSDKPGCSPLPLRTKKENNFYQYLHHYFGAS